MVDNFRNAIETCVSVQAMADQGSGGAVGIPQRMTATLGQNEARGSSNPQL